MVPLCNEYFGMLKESWMFDIVQLLKIMLRFILFSLYLRVFILSFQTCSKQEAVLSSGIVWPDNFFLPFLNIELRPKKQSLSGFDAVLRPSRLITWERCFLLNQKVVLKYQRWCYVRVPDTWVSFIDSPSRRPRVALGGWQQPLVVNRGLWTSISLSL